MNVFKGIYLIALVAGLAGCASTSGAQNEPTASTAAASHEHSTGMMSGMCPMKVAGTTVAPSDIEAGVSLNFTTTSGDVAELRQRVRRMAEMHEKSEGDKMMGGPEGDKMMGGPDGGGHDGTMMGGRGMMMMPAAIASAQDIEHGATFVLRPKDPAELVALREHVHMKAKRMAGGECPMMSLGGGEPAASSPAGADHDAHHPAQEGGNHGSVHR